jgi:Zn finger protein HypA/HybF involved in hydrogenase expression
MNISNLIPDLKAELYFSKTATGRTVNEKAKESIQAMLSDTKNYEVDAVKCLNCGIILSSLLIQSGCPNCGGSDLTTIIGQKDTLKGERR